MERSIDDRISEWVDSKEGRTERERRKISKR
jgi:hypothetical protein